MLIAGCYRVDITPPVGAPLAGFAARRGVSIGVHDALYARALVLELGDRRVAFVSVDVLGLSAEFVAKVRARIVRETGIPGGAVMISATHTHAGPVTVSTFFNPGESLDARYMERLSAAITHAVAAAHDAGQPARAGVGSGSVQGIGSNRRSPDRVPVDEQVGILRVDAADGRPLAVLFNYACHPTVLGPDNLLFSGDFAAPAVDRVEGRLGNGAQALYVNGAQGDISMGHSSELSAIGVITPGRTFERAAQLGSQLGDAVADALASIATRPDPVLAATSDLVTLPFNAYPPSSDTAAALRDAERALAELEQAGLPTDTVGPARTRRLYASIRHFYAGEAQRANGGGLPVEIQGIRVDDALFVGVPGEVFVEIGQRVKRAATHPLFLMGITNGYVGYLPTRAAYEAGGYEVVSAKVTDAAEDLLAATILEVDARLFPVSPSLA